MVGPTSYQVVTVMVNVCQSLYIQTVILILPWYCPDTDKLLQLSAMQFCSKLTKHGISMHVVCITLLINNNQNQPFI